MFKNNKFNQAALTLYFVYFLHGIQSIILTQNATFFADRWGTTTAEVFNVLAWVGIGKFIFLIFSGPISDKIGRKPVAYVGMIGYLLMYVIYLFSSSLPLAYFASFLGGASTSMFDGSINPAYMEIYPENKSTASIINKGFISVSSALYPLFVGWIANSQLATHWVITVPLILSVIVIIALTFVTLPDGAMKKVEDISAAEAIQKLEQDQKESSKTQEKIEEPSMWIEGLSLILFAFFIYSTFYLFQQVVSIYATDIVGMGEVASRSLVTYYQVGSFVAVILSAIIMARGVRDMALLIIYPLASAIMGFIIYFFPNEITLTVGSIVIGYAAAGGALQMGNALLNQFIDTQKGRNTSIYYLSMSAGSFLMPAIAGHLQTANFELVMLLVGIVATIASALMIFLGFRYKRIFGVSAFNNTNQANLEIEQ
jgi:MFS family permease